MHNSPLFFAAGVPGSRPGRDPVPIVKKLTIIIFEKVLDKSIILWYNMYVSEARVVRIPKSTMANRNYAFPLLPRSI